MIETARCWIELKQNHLLHNYHYFKNLTNTEICAILKGNFMGHGAIQAATILQANGCKSFGVATIEEAIELRNNHITQEILLLSPLNILELDLAIKYQLTLPLCSKNYLEAFIKHPKADQIKTYLKLDTGMHRLGFVYEELPELIELIKQHKLKPQGCFSHLCMCDIKSAEAKSITQTQIESFNQALQLFEANGLSFPTNHLLATNGALNYSAAHYDMLRIGMGLCGVLSSSDASFKPHDLKPILSLKARIMQIKAFNHDEGIGYGYKYVAHNHTLIATISCGFADGYPRNLSNLTHVYINQQYAPIVGTICMDSMSVDVSNITCCEGDIVEIIGEHISANELAKLLNTSSVDILSRLSTRLPRIIT